MRQLAAWGMLMVWLIGFSTAHAAEASVPLQQLIDQTAAGGVIQLEPQTYTGNIVIDKPLTLRGRKGTVIRGDGNGDVVTIKGDGVKLEQLAVEHSSLSRNAEEEFAAVKIFSSHNQLEDLQVRDAYHGISIYYGQHNTVRRATITGQGSGEIAGQGNGIQLMYASHNRLDQVKIDGTRDGIYFYYAEQNDTSNSEITHTRYGLHFMYADGNRFDGNQFSRNIGGAAIMHSKGLELRNNVFAFHQGTRSFGLMLQASDENLVSDNRFIQNQRSLYLDQAQRNRVIDNQFVHNQIGVELWASSADQVFSGNRFFRNTAAVLLIGGESRNRWAENGRGNDWGTSVPLLDLNGDGIGDTPVEYRSSLHNIVEEHELAYLFLNSPAIHLYEKWQALKMGQEVMVTDPYPLVSREKGAFSAWTAAAGLGVIGGWVMLARRRKST